MFSKYSSCLYSIRTEVFFVFFARITTLYVLKELKIRGIYLVSHKRCLLQIKEKVLGIFFSLSFLLLIICCTGRKYVFFFLICTRVYIPKANATECTFEQHALAYANIKYILRLRQFPILILYSI
jgi:hypothetical protein